MPSDPASVRIRPASKADAGPVTALLLAQLREHGSSTPSDDIARTVTAMLQRRDRGRLIVATEGDRIVGVAALVLMWSLEHGGRSVWLDELYVEPALRERGIGRELLAAACRTAAEAGFAAIDLEVDANHARASRLYAREGFTSLERRRWVRILPAAPPTPPARAIAVPRAGGCLCGAIRYRVSEPPVELAHCHCRLCRRATGAPVVPWATFRNRVFDFTSGAPAEFKSSAHAVRGFCNTCGTALTFREAARPDMVDVTIGSFDEPDDLAPREHIWTSRQLPWLVLDDDLPRFAEENPGELGRKP